MAFSFGASTPSGGGGGNAQAELGPELPEVLTEVCREALQIVFELGLFC